MKAVSVRSLPLHKPVILQKDKSLKQAAQAMKNNQVGSVLVSDGRGLLKGIFTDRDLALALAIENKNSNSALEEVTRQRLVYVTETATLEDVIQTMQDFAVRRIPVVHMRPNGKQRCLGIITLDDLVKANLIDAKIEAAILNSQLKNAPTKAARQLRSPKSIFHRQGNKEHSYHTFIKTFENHLGLNKTHTLTLVQDTLTLLLRRLSNKAGQNLISQLPYEEQMQLLSAISPTDRRVTAKAIMSHVQRRLNTSESGAKILLEKFWQGLAATVSPGEIANLQRELPRDINLLFTPSPH